MDFWAYKKTHKERARTEGARYLKALKQKKQQLVGGLKHISQIFNMFPRL